MIENDDKSIAEKCANTGGWNPSRSGKSGPQLIKQEPIDINSNYSTSYSEIVKVDDGVRSWHGGLIIYLLILIIAGVIALVNYIF